jgi:hypothetical protein
MICQLPRVDDRLLAMMWLLAESWGRVTASGTLLPLQLTHSALGGLVGARRPTVTLALRGLTESGAVLRQPDGWLLLKSPDVQEAASPEVMGEVRPLERVAARWGFKTPPAAEEAARLAGDAAAHAELLRTVSRLAAEHRERTEAVRTRLDAMIASRASIAARRARLSEAGRPRRAPSSRSHP